MQHRYFNFGEPASAAIFKEMLSGITGKCVLSGGDIGIATPAITNPPTQPDRIIINPVWVMLDSPRLTEQGMTRANVLLFEDEVKQMIVPIGSSASNWTIVYRHNDADVIGGNSAALTLDSGLIRSQDIPDGVALGYVLYPGGGVGLNPTMIIQAPREKLQAHSDPTDGMILTPPFTSMLYTYLGASPMPGFDTIDDPVWRQCLQIDNTASLVPSLDRLRWSFVVGAVPPRSIVLDYVQETSQQITLDIEDTEGNVSSGWGSGTVLSQMLTQDFSSDFVLETQGSQQLRRRRLRITNGQFTQGKRFRVQATISTPAAKRTLVTGAGFSTYNQPFAG